MEIGDVVVLIVLLGGTLLFWQRTVGRLRWLTVLILVLPVIFFSYRWSIFRDEKLEWRVAIAIATALNALFWLVRGRRYPPGYQGEIIVLGIDDEE